MTATEMYVTDAQLNELSSSYPSSKYCLLCHSLGLLCNQGVMILASRNGNYQEALGLVLRLWKERTGGSQTLLQAALRDAGAREFMTDIIFKENTNGSQTRLQADLRDAGAGEFMTDMYVTDAQLDELSSSFPSSKYCLLCNSLGLLCNQGVMILASRNGNYQEALGLVLRLWKERTGGSQTRLRVALRTAGAGELIGE